MNDEINKEKPFTLKGLRTVTIFYTVMFLTSALILISQGFFDSYVSSILTFIGAILVLFSLLLIYFGINDIHRGSTEFNPEHEKNVLVARKLIFWGIILVFISGFILIPFSRHYEIINAVIRTIFYVPFLLALVYLIKEIATKHITNLLWTAFFSRIILYFISNLTSLVTLTDTKSILTDYSVFIHIVAILPSIIFIYCYYGTYVRVRDMEFFPSYQS